MNCYCTLFDSNYLDKGLALYFSMERVIPEFKLYIFAFDSKCELILKKLELKNAVIIGMKEFETEEMIKVKSERSRAEYCWTCTPISIEYVLEKYNEKICTYVDADLYFFSNPQVLLDEITDTHLSILLTEHRFANNEDGLKAMEKNGKYCVEFNTFKNDKNGMTALKWWKEKCLEWCFFKHEENRMGDQKYLNDWVEMFPGVHELQNLGGGVAPWNIAQYSLVRNENEIILKEKTSGICFPLVFYHFQNIRYITYDIVNIRSQCSEVELKKAIYVPYLKEIELIRKMLKEEFDFTVSIAKSCSGNKIVAFIQRNIIKYKIKDLTDLINLRKLM